MGRLTAEQAAEWTCGTWAGVPPTAFAGVATDSRAMTAGALYIAIKGERYDGHAFVDAALQAGATAAMVNESDPRPDCRAATLCVRDTKRALWDLAAGYRMKVAPRMIGVTGSVGKSTVKEMLAAVLGHAHVTSCTHANWNNDIGLPLSLLAMDPQSEYGVFEVGTSHPGEVADLCCLLKPQWGVVTNIGPAHLEFFGSEEGVAREKGDLLAALPSDGVAFLDADGSCFNLLQARSAARVVSVALNGTADFTATSDHASSDRVDIIERATGAIIPLPRLLAGEHHVRNLLLTVAVAREAAMPWDLIRAGLKTFKPLPMRWECRVIAGVHVVNDAYNANPLSMQAALRTFNDYPAAGRRWLVLGDMLELGDVAMEAHDTIGRQVAAGAWAGVATVGPLATHIADAVQAHGRQIEAVACTDATEAGAWVMERMLPGDALLLKGSRGMHLERVMDVMAGAAKGGDDAS